MKGPWGNCQKSYHSASKGLRGPICYVNEPSACKDAVNSPSTGKHVSWEACCKYHDNSTTKYQKCYYLSVVRRYCFTFISNVDTNKDIFILLFPDQASYFLAGLNKLCGEDYPLGDTIDDLELCKHAGNSMGFSFREMELGLPHWVPKGCFAQRGSFYFNADENGKRNNEANPICKQGSFFE